MMQEELGICDDCEAPVELIEIRKGRCSDCGKFIDPWEIGFAGDLHQAIERKITKRDSD